MPIFNHTSGKESSLLLFDNSTKVNKAVFSRVGSLLNAMTTSQDSNAEEYHSVLTSIGEAGLWNEKGRIATRIDRLTEASREVRTQENALA